MARVTELSDKDYIAFDTETTGVSKDSIIIGVSWAYDVGEAYYAIIHYWDGEKLVEVEGMAAAVRLLLLVLKNKNLIMHNSVFDCSMVENNYRIALMDAVHTDTMILAHLVDENRRVGLKDLGVSIFGEDAGAEQAAMKESITANGGKVTKTDYELYKGDADLIGLYGAKDALLTLKVFYHEVEKLFEQGLDKFFYEEESMPLLRGPTYQMNTTGLRVDTQALQVLKSTLEAEILETKAYIYQEITPLVQPEYAGTKKTNTFNIGSGPQLAWLLFIKLGVHFDTLSDAGQELCRALELPLPYTVQNKHAFISMVNKAKGQTYMGVDAKTKKPKQKKIRDVWNYFRTDADTLAKFADKYRWVARLLELKKAEKILGTYVIGIGEQLQYGVIRPSFSQHGTKTGRYSSKSPNFQNLPRKEKRVKACIISRPGRVFVGADADQLEPRCFSSIAGDSALQGCFSSGDDFYSVVGAPIFNKQGVSLIKDAPGSFSVLYPDLRDKTKVIALATPYGRTAGFMASQMGNKREEAQEMMDDYFMTYPKVHQMMLDSHEMVKRDGHIKSIFGRVRRLPEAKLLPKKAKHADLPYNARNVLNQAMNFRVQSTGASIMNRAAIAFYSLAKELELDVQIVMQVHDELIVECAEGDKESVAALLKECMENTVELPGVKLSTTPKIANNLKDLK